MLVLENTDLLQGDATTAAEVDFVVAGLDNNALKLLASGQLPNAKGTLYTSNSTDLVHTITLVNTGAAHNHVNLYVAPAAGTSRRLIAKDLQLESGYSLHFDGKSVMILDTAGGIVSGLNVSDTAYAASWDGVTGIAPSKNAVYDKIQAITVPFSTAAEVIAGLEAAKAIAPDQLKASNLWLVGEIKAVAFETVPSGWLECNGASLVRGDYAALFTAIGTNFGTADGTHFNIPDLRGKFPRGWDHAAANDPNRAARTAQAAGGQTGDHVGTIQADGFKAHIHGLLGGDTGGGGTMRASSLYSNLLNTLNSGSTGDNETRPINVGVMYIIKT